jgi:hypothetical protein
VRIDHRDGLDHRELAGARGVRAGVEDALDAELDVLRGERVAAVEADVLPQVEEVGRGVRRLPPQRERRLQRPLRRVADELLVDVVLERVGGRPVVDVGIPAGGVPQERHLEQAARLRRGRRDGDHAEEDQEDERQQHETPYGDHE